MRASSFKFCLKSDISTELNEKKGRENVQIEKITENREKFSSKQKKKWIFGLAWKFETESRTWWQTNR